MLTTSPVFVIAKSQSAPLPYVKPKAVRVCKLQDDHCDAALRMCNSVVPEPLDGPFSMPTKSESTFSIQDQTGAHIVVVVAVVAPAGIGVGLGNPPVVASGAAVVVPPGAGVGVGVGLGDPPVVAAGAAVVVPPCIGVGAGVGDGVGELPTVV